jgi:HlyD family secretion protein
LAQAEILLKDILEDREKLDYQRASQNTLDELRGNYLLAQQAVEDAEETYSFVQDRDEDDLERAQALIFLSRVRKTRDRALENLNYALGKPDPQDIAEADAKVQVARERVEDAKRKLNNLKDGPDLDNLQLAKAQLKNSELQLASAKAALDDIELRAPFTGVVATTNLKVGQFIGPGQPAVEIGDLTKWVVETTDLTELDVVGIAPGDRVEVEFDAIPDLLLGGEVTQVKPRGQNTRGDITYVVVINLDEQDERLLWAMSAVVRFIQN